MELQPFHPRRSRASRLPAGHRYAVYYHPPSRFWRFQWTEAGILVLASAALGGLAVRRTLRRPG
ncbi:hypothetical protein ACFFV7_00950 [Nonomuraea spiralis]|uniref:Uncharacterized protein n=1 Tax=Nonomuraea spiralis TaxID=46182 RepID=A0ABV5I5D1_9ACTN|nr:hypothetical protein [Nonomuraea spiralis]GGS63314.1 hypothetical protein GCM10010176_001880 [Nonomuraea spiralis]